MAVVSPSEHEQRVPPAQRYVRQRRLSLAAATVIAAIIGAIAAIIVSRPQQMQLRSDNERLEQLLAEQNKIVQRLAAAAEQNAREVQSLRNSVVENAHPVPGSAKSESGGLEVIETSPAATTPAKHTEEGVTVSAQHDAAIAQPKPRRDRIEGDVVRLAWVGDDRVVTVRALWGEVDVTLDRRAQILWEGGRYGLDGLEAGDVLQVRLDDSGSIEKLVLLKNARISPPKPESGPRTISGLISGVPRKLP